MGEDGYWLMDDRANYDTDKAFVLMWCDTLQEAKDAISLFGSDTCIVDVKTQTVIHALN
jgi:hypothetical protein